MKLFVLSFSTLIFGMKIIRKKIAGQANIRIKTESPEKALFQAIVARGDRPVGHALQLMTVDNLTWRKAFARLNINFQDYVRRPRKLNEFFPWEIIDHGIDRKYLWLEYQKALQGKPTVPCDTSQCKRCGVC